MFNKSIKHAYKYIVNNVYIQVYISQVPPKNVYNIWWTIIYMVQYSTFSFIFRVPLIPKDIDSLKCVKKNKDPWNL